MNGKSLFILVCICLLTLTASFSEAVPINLNDFFADPTVTVAPDGSSATLNEDAFFSPVLLSNDPGLGDPTVIIPGIGVSLIFDFIFNEPAGNDDEFGAFVLDGATGLSVGAGFEFFTAGSSSGTVSFDLTSLDGMLLGLQFQLSAFPGDPGLDSSVTISNVRLDSAAVPEPATMLLLGSGLIGIGVVRRKMRRSFM